MIEFILGTLAEFGLQYSNHKHQKKVITKEKENGIKRPFEKYLWSPVARTTIIIIALFFLFSFLFTSYQNKITLPNNTKQEIIEMSDYITDWKTKFGMFPQDFTEFTNGSPLRQTWLYDSWNRPYLYLVGKDKNSFSIKSAGSDGKFNTIDDIILE